MKVNTNILNFSSQLVQSSFFIEPVIIKVKMKLYRNALVSVMVYSRFKFTCTYSAILIHFNPY